MAVSQKDAMLVLRTLGLSTAQEGRVQQRSPARLLADRLRPYLSQKHLDQVAKATGAELLVLEDTSFLCFEERDDVRWKAFGVEAGANTPLPTLARMASDSVLRRGVVRLRIGKASELWMSRRTLHKARRQKLHGGGRRTVHAVLHRGACDMDVNRMLEKVGDTKDVPYELKRTLFRDVLERSLESPTGPCQAIARNLWVLLGKRFASEGWSVRSFLGAGRTGIIFGVGKGRVSRALKVVALRSSRDRQDLRKEMRLQRRFREAGIAPEVYGHRIYERSTSRTPCIGAGGFLMQTVEPNVRQLFVGPQPADKIRRFCKGIAKAIGAAAAAGLVHGDLHSGNLAFHDGRVLFIDFGWATEKPWPLFDGFKFCRSLLNTVFQVLNNFLPLGTDPLCQGETAVGKVRHVQKGRVRVDVGSMLISVVVPPGAPAFKVGQSMKVRGTDTFWGCTHFRQCFDRAFLCFGHIYKELRQKKMKDDDKKALRDLKRVFMFAKKQVDAAESNMQARKAIFQAHSMLRPTYHALLNQYRLRFGEP